MHCKQGMPGAGAGAAAAAAAFGGVRVIDDADVGALEGVAELGVVQLADGARQILWGVKLHHAQHTAAVAEHIHIVWRAHLAEMVLPEQTTLVILLAAGLTLCRGLLSFLKKLLIRMHAKVEVCTGLTACSTCSCITWKQSWTAMGALGRRGTFRSCQEADMGRFLTMARYALPLARKLEGTGGGALLPKLPRKSSLSRGGPPEFIPPLFPEHEHQQPSFHLIAQYFPFSCHWIICMAYLLPPPPPMPPLDSSTRMGLLSNM